MIQFRCSCGHQVQVDDEFAGKKTICPTCAQATVVPRAGATQPLTSAPAPFRTPAQGGKLAPPGEEEVGPQPLGSHRGERRTSGLAIAAFVVSMIGILVWCIPYAGFMGALGAGLGWLDLSRRDPWHKRGLSISACVVGLLAALTAAVWLWVLESRLLCCPHVYSYDGERYVLDADPLSGSLLQGAEREDQDRLEAIVPVDGCYRLRVVNELEEVDHIDAIALRIVDHAMGEEVLPSPSGDLVRVAAALPPSAGVDGKGRDVRPLILAEDGRTFQGRAEDFPDEGAREPVEFLDLTFPRPAPGRRPVLVLRSRCTPLAARAFAQYLAGMGAGAVSLLRFAQDSSRYPYRQRLADELRRMGLVSSVGVRMGDGWACRTEIHPIGPAVMRSLAIPLEAPETGATVSVRVEMTPLLWEVDQVLLGHEPGEPDPTTLHPRTVRGHRGGDRTAELAVADEVRVTLASGEWVDAEFEAPPLPAGKARTVVLRIRGYYEVEFGGPPAINAAAMVRHWTGGDSLQRQALRLAREAASGR